MRVRRMATAALAVVVAGSLVAGCGSGGGKKRRSGGSSHSSSGGGSSGYTTGGSSHGSTTGGSSYATPTTTSTSSSPPRRGFDFSDVSTVLESTYANVPTCGTGKWTDADLTTRVPASHHTKIVVMRSYDCYAKPTDTKPEIAGLGAFISFADKESAARYLRDAAALTGVSGYIVDDTDVLTVGNPAGLRNPRSMLDQVNLACRRCGTITAI